MSGLVVIFQGPEANPRVYEVDGTEVTNRVQSITILPGRAAEAVLLLHRNGAPYLLEGTEEVAKETRRVVEIGAKRLWTARVTA